MNERPILYVCAPYGTRTLVEQTQTDLAIRKAVAEGYCPVFVPHVLAPAGIDDLDPEQRKAGLECCSAIIPRCDAFLLVCPRVTPGVQHDWDKWVGTVGALFFEDSDGARPSFRWPDLPSVADWKERRSRRERRR